MNRFLLILVMLAATAGAVVAYGDPDRISHASDSISHMLREQSLSPPRRCKFRAARAASSR